MAVIFTDDFNRANGNPGANWEEMFGSDWNIINTSQLEATSQSQHIEYTGSSLADCDVMVKHIGTGINPGGVTARKAVGVDTFYIWRLYSDGGWELCRKVTGSIGVVLNDGGTKLTLVSGGIIRMKVTGVGATVTIDLYYNGAFVTSYADTDATRITVAGRAGIYTHATVTGIFDDFVLDDAAAADLNALIGEPISGSSTLN